MKKVLPSSHALIPDNAKLAFKGILFDVYQWPQKMFDGTTKTFEMLKRPDTVQVLVVKGSQILLVDDEQPGRTPRLHFPGGRADNDASWLEAGKRELREESGLECGDWKLIEAHQPIIKIEWFTPILLATNITADHGQSLDADGEKISLQWREFTDVRELVLSGEEQTMQYLVPFFNRVENLQQLLNMSEFQGQIVDR